MLKAQKAGGKGRGIQRDTLKQAVGRGKARGRGRGNNQQTTNNAPVTMPTPQGGRGRGRGRRGRAGRGGGATPVETIPMEVFAPSQVCPACLCWYLW